MYSITAIAAALILHAAPAIQEAPPAEGRILRHSGVVHASAEDLWRTFTTPEGWTSAIGVAKSEIDLRLGGTIRSVYDPNATLGDDTTITNTILAYEPGRMIALKATAPKDAPDFIKAVCETGWSVIRLEPLTPGRTRLVVTGMGYQDTELHRKAYEFFDQGNAWTIRKIQDHFSRPEHAAAISDAEKLLNSMVGEWSFSKKQPDGSEFGGTSHGVLLFEGRTLVVDGHLTIGGKTFHHAHFIAGYDPGTEALRAWSFNEVGDVTEGQIRLESPGKLVVDWHTDQRAGGKHVQYRVEYTFNGPDEYRCVVLHPPRDDGTRETLVDITYRRTKEGAR